MEAALFHESVDLSELESDPYPFYARMRKEAPIAWVPVLQGWLVSRWEDCKAIGMRPDDFVAPGLNDIGERIFGGHNVLSVDGPKHQDLRTGIDPSLTPRCVKSLAEDIIRGIARSRIDRFAHLGAVDLTQEYFEPVSVESLRHVLGLDAHVDAQTLIRWFHDLSAGNTNYLRDPQIFARSDKANSEIEALLLPLIERLQKEERNDGMLWHLVHTGRDPGNYRSLDEILPSLKVILLGGMQEPGHAAASAMLGLLSDPAQLKAVINDQALIPNAVQEGLRWIAPIGFAERLAVGDHELSGVAIPDGALVQVCLASANRDPEIFDDPERYDVFRERIVHQSFGQGKHFCAGHFFARAIIKVMLEELFARIPSMRLDPDREPIVSGLGFRGPKSLPVVWEK